MLLETLETIRPSSAPNLCSEKETRVLYGDRSSNAGVSVRGRSVLAKIALRELLMGERGLRDRGRLWTATYRYMQF